MLFAAYLALCVVSVPLAGGRLEALADVRLRRTWLILGAFAAQVLIMAVVPAAEAVPHEAIHVGTYVLAGCFVWWNRHVPGLLIVGAGGALNFLAIVANGGVMPASPEALQAAGMTPPDGFLNSGPVENPRLGFLGDVFAIPDGSPVHNVFSVGDVVIGVGALVGVHRICGSRATRRGPGPAFAVDAFEVVRASSRHALVRLAGCSTDSAGDPVALVVDDGVRGHRFAPLAGPGGAALAFPVPRALVEGRRPAFALELRSGDRLELPSPRPR